MIQMFYVMIKYNLLIKKSQSNYYKRKNIQHRLSFTYT